MLEEDHDGEPQGRELPAQRSTSNPEILLEHDATDTLPEKKPSHDRDMDRSSGRRSHHGRSKSAHRTRVRSRTRADKMDGSTNRRRQRQDNSINGEGEDKQTDHTRRRHGANETSESASNHGRRLRRSPKPAKSSSHKHTKSLSPMRKSKRTSSEGGEHAHSPPRHHRNKRGGSADKTGRAKRDSSADKTGRAKRDSSADKTGRAKRDSSADKTGRAKRDSSADKTGRPRRDSSADKTGRPRRDSSADHTGRPNQELQDKQGSNRSLNFQEIATSSGQTSIMYSSKKPTDARRKNMGNLLDQSLTADLSKSVLATIPNLDSLGGSLLDDSAADITASGLRKPSLTEPLYDDPLTTSSRKQATDREWDKTNEESSEEKPQHLPKESRSGRSRSPKTTDPGSRPKQSFPRNPSRSPGPGGARSKQTRRRVDNHSSHNTTSTTTKDDKERGKSPSDHDPASSSDRKKGNGQRRSRSPLEENPTSSGDTATDRKIPRPPRLTNRDRALSDKAMPRKRTSSADAKKNKPSSLEKSTRSKPLRRALSFDRDKSSRTAAMTESNTSSSRRLQRGERTPPDRRSQSNSPSSPKSPTNEVDNELFQKLQERNRAKIDHRASVSRKLGDSFSSLNSSSASLNRERTKQRNRQILRDSRRGSLSSQTSLPNLPTQDGVAAGLYSQGPPSALGGNALYMPHDDLSIGSDMSAGSSYMQFDPQLDGTAISFKKQPSEQSLNNAGLFKMEDALSQRSLLKQGKEDQQEGNASNNSLPSVSLSVLSGDENTSQREQGEATKKGKKKKHGVLSFASTMLPRRRRSISLDAGKFDAVLQKIGNENEGAVSEQVKDDVTENEEKNDNDNTDGKTGKSLPSRSKSAISYLKKLGGVGGGSSSSSKKPSPPKEEEEEGGGNDSPVHPLSPTSSSKRGITLNIFRKRKDDKRKLLDSGNDSESDG